MSRRTTAAMSRITTSRPSCSRARRLASSLWDRHLLCFSAASISLSARSPASSSSSRRSSCSTVAHPRSGLSGSADARLRACRWPFERRAHSLREVHRRCSDTRHVHRPGRLELHASLCARRIYRHFGDRRHLQEGRAGASCLRRVRVCRWPRVRPRRPRFGMRLRAVG